MNILEHTNTVFTQITKKTDKIILFYSCGKDSIALVDLCSKHFKEVVCVFMYFVKDLEHINRYIRFTEAKYSNVTFKQVPHWNLTYILRGGIYCDANPNQKILKLIDIDEAIRAKTGIKWSAYGMKKADSMNRNLMLKTYELEAINPDTNKVYPLSLWKTKDVLRYIQMNGLPEPINYGSAKKSSGVSFDLDVFLYLRQYYPGDLQKILKQFPMAEKILFEHDYKEKRKSQWQN